MCVFFSLVFINYYFSFFFLATISVLPRMIVDTLQSFGQVLKLRSDNLKNQSSFGGSTLNLSPESTTPSILRNGASVQNLSSMCVDINNNGSDNTDIINEFVQSQIPGMPSRDDLICREVGFIMLQLVNAFKNVQSKGIEELPLSLSNVILYKELENKDIQAKLCVLHG